MAAAVGAVMVTEGAQSQSQAQTQARPSASAPVTAYVGLGSNLDDPQARVRRALDALATLPATRLVSASLLYATAPVGPQDQPDYVNAVARLATELTPSDLLAALLGIEAAQGRQRDGTRWGPRTLDLDLLLHGQARLALAGLHLPHPQIRHRAFVLVPLADVAPSDLNVPGQGILGDLLRACPADGVRPIT
jgi:2-amino-4-hydroxy-6-hydroxymethyldihydropteridine diphosphokinase